jgi:hypothetical protein
VEFAVNPSCTGALAYTTLDGLSKAPFLQRTPPVLRVTNFVRTSAAANGTEICLVLRPPCMTLGTLCPGGVCKYAIFDGRSSKTKCCPVGAVVDLSSNAAVEVKTG